MYTQAMLDMLAHSNRLARGVSMACDPPEGLIKAKHENCTGWLNDGRPCSCKHHQGDNRLVSTWDETMFARFWYLTRGRDYGRWGGRSQ